MSQLVGWTRSPVRQPQQPMGLLWAYLGLSFALAWAAWLPAAVLFRDPQRPGLPSFAGGLVVLQTLGAAAPTLAAYLVLRVGAGAWSSSRLSWAGSASGRTAPTSSASLVQIGTACPLDHGHAILLAVQTDPSAQELRRAVGGQRSTL